MPKPSTSLLYPLVLFSAGIFAVLLPGCGPELPPYEGFTFRTMEQWAKIDAVAMPQEAVELLAILEEVTPKHLNPEVQEQRELLRKIRNYANPEKVTKYADANFVRDRDMHAYLANTDGSVSFEVRRMTINMPLKKEELQWDVRLDAGWYARKQDLEAAAEKLFQEYADKDFLVFSSTFENDLLRLFK